MTTERRSSSNRQTHSTTQASLRLCVRCGARLASANTSRVCYCHERNYDPRIDGEWPAKLVAYAASSVGQTIHPTAHFGIVPQARNIVCRSVAKLRAQGWIIESTRGRDSYIVLVVPPRVKCGILPGQGEMPTDERDAR